MFIRSTGKEIDINFKAFPRPMGVFSDKTRLTLGTYNHVMEFKRSDKMLKKIKEGALDSLSKFTKNG